MGGEIIYTWKVLEKTPVPSESLQENQEFFRRLYLDGRVNITVAYNCKLPRQKQTATTSSVSNIRLTAEHSPRQSIPHVNAVWAHPLRPRQFFLSLSVILRTLTSK